MSTVEVMDLQLFADPLNTTSDINTGSGATATKPAAFYSKRLQEKLRQKLFLHEKYAQKRDMPKNYGDTIQFRQTGTLAPATTPLTEGTTPSGSSATVTAISTTTSQYGDYLYFSDKVDFEMVDPIITDYNEEQGNQAGETLDVIIRDEIHGGSNVFYAGGRTDRSGLTSGDIPTIDDLRKMRLQLKVDHVPTINGKYIVLVTPAQVMDLMDDSRFEKAYEIGQNNKPMIEGEIADIYGMKFIEVNNGKVFVDSGADDDSDGTGDYTVHSALMFGRDAYGITRINGEGSVKSIVKGKGSAGTDDPLDQRQSIGWKVNAFAVKRLNESKMIRYENIPSEGETFFDQTVEGETTI